MTHIDYTHYSITHNIIYMSIKRRKKSELLLLAKHSGRAMLF
jgi:hypothetical protein